MSECPKMRSGYGLYVNERPVIRRLALKSGEVIHNVRIETFVDSIPGFITLYDAYDGEDLLTFVSISEIESIVIDRKEMKKTILRNHLT